MMNWFPFQMKTASTRGYVRSGAKRPVGYRPAVEILEDRCLLSGDGPKVLPPGAWDGLQYGTTDGLGVNIHFTSPQPGEAAMLAASGVRWVRMDLTWRNTERQPGQYDFSAYDTLLNALKPYGIRTLFTMDYGNALYDQGLAPYDDAGRLAFTNWATAAFQHFQGQGILWELWNEPNIARFWTPAPDVQNYIQLALDVGKALRSVAPGETFIGPATSTIDFAFLQACFQGGLLNYFDAVSVHPYRSTGPETAAADYATLRQLIDQYAPPGKVIPILSGEWGYSAVGRGDPLQGALLAREWLTNLANDIPLSIWYDWHDDGTDPGNAEHNYGTVAYHYYAGRDPVYDPKPGYQSAATLTTLLAGDTYQGRLGLAQDTDYALAFGDGASTRYVAWTTSATAHTVTLPLPPGLYAEVSDTGAGLGVAAADTNGLTVTLTGAPVYLVPSDGSGPAAPVNLAATAGKGLVTLSWAAAAGATGYDIYRGTTPGGEAPIPIARGVTATAFTDTGLASGATYYYRVTAANASGESAPSNEGAATLARRARFAVAVNFSDDQAAAPTGYLHDVGLPFEDQGDGFRFGWNQDTTADATDNYIAMQNPDNPDASWRVALPNGTYRVRVGVGDPGDDFDASYAVDVQGVLAVSGTPTPEDKFFAGTVAVSVTDGYLTVSNDSEAVNNKIDYIDIMQLAPAGIDFSGGFAGAAGLALNNGVTITADGRLRLTDGDVNESRSAFVTAPVVIQRFTTAFRFQLTDAYADGFTFTLQGVGDNARGGIGGTLGYQGIARSVAVKFDLYNNEGEGPDSTGLYTDGRSPTTPAIDLSGTGIDLHSGDMFDVSMSYDGSVLAVTITDEVTGATAVQRYPIDIPAVIGSPLAYAGFTAGTGGVSAVQDILDWTGQFPIPRHPPAQLDVSALRSIMAATPVAMTVSLLDAAGHRAGDHDPVPLTSPAVQAALPTDDPVPAVDAGRLRRSARPKLATTPRCLSILDSPFSDGQWRFWGEGNEAL